MAQILDMACDTLNAWLIQKLQTELTSGDPERAITVRSGRLQDNPTKNEVYILTQPGDPEEPDKWMHSAASMKPNGLVGDDLNLPPWQVIGNREAEWWRRFTVNVGWFNLGFDRDTAREHALKVFGRTELAIQQCPDLRGLKDEFGELIQAVYIVKDYFTESGGPPKSFIWRGKIYVAMMTCR